MVTDNSSIISQGFLYAPFGEIISEYTPGWETDRIPKYAFNAKELDEENGMYYYSARYYAPPTFISRDPKFEKYPSISPYTYCANNPIILVDDDGQEIRIYYKEKTGIARLFEKPKSIVYTPGMIYSGGNKFVQNAVNSLNYVYNNKADIHDVISQSAATKDVVKIKKGNSDYFDPRTNTIRWTMKGMIVNDNSSGNNVEGRQSGALGLFHELGHFFQITFNYNQYINDCSTPDAQYDDAEEKRNIEQFETPAAKILGEGTRNNHSGDDLNTANPISTKTKKEIKQELESKTNE